MYLIRSMERKHATRIPYSSSNVGCRPVRPNGPGERSPGPRPKADALGGEIDNAVRPERPRDGWPGVGGPRLGKFSRPFRPQGWDAIFPRASAFGLGPGLESPAPLGR